LCAGFFRICQAFTRHRILDEDLTEDLREQIEYSNAAEGNQRTCVRDNPFSQSL